MANSYRPCRHDNLNYDFALLELRSAIKFTRYVAPVCLPRYGSRKSYVGDTAIATGWGLVHGKANRPPNVLREVVLEVLGNQRCGKYPPGRVTFNMLCATGPNRNFAKDSCYGDSGGKVF